MVMLAIAILYGLSMLIIVSILFLVGWQASQAERRCAKRPPDKVAEGR